MDKHRIGQRGEDLAANFLQKKGYRILERNFRAEGGEIDIIAQDNDYICFIEVKMRSSTLFGTPAEAVNYKKQNRIKKLSQIYLKENGLSDKPQRFDILEIIMEYNNKYSNSKIRYINLIRNAF